MYRFSSDYLEGAHPRLLEKLIQTNAEQTAPYGEDVYCRAAADLIRLRCRNRGAAVVFVPGGTMANLAVAAACLRPHQGVLSAQTGHVNTHEAGAIEATGHRVLALPSQDGKLSAEQIRKAMLDYRGDPVREHTVQPKLVYISQPTELGTVYSLGELEQISAVCREFNLFLYVDGARLAYALRAEKNDVDLPDLAQLTDVFLIGGTKVGALFGEALVIPSPALQADFRSIVKQRGGLMAKGRLMGLQFLALFEDDLYFDIAEHANRMAQAIRQACREAGYPFLVDSPTNQQFPILPNALVARLSQDFDFSLWQDLKDSQAVRFCTSWATPFSAVESLAAAIRAGA
ncbi:MAG: low specificity L-threonine aldolase [Clostridiales bacterium]|nr:low specificity L-threonine aldolase [Clostridiales bacterium]